MPRPTKEQLKEMAVHVIYDALMLDEAYKLYREEFKNKSPRWALALECLLLHIRILRDFFLEKSRYGDDLMASDYFDNPVDWHHIAGIPDPAFDRLRERMNKQLAHLSLKRAEYSEEEFIWSAHDQAAIHKAIVDLKSKFYNSLSPERRQWFDSPLRASGNGSVSNSTQSD